MSKTLTSLLTLTALLASSAANNIAFFPPGSCNLDRGHHECTKVEKGTCCVVASPYCGSLSCAGCAKGTDLWAFEPGKCNIQSFRVCREPGDGAFCCVKIYNVASCASHWLAGASKRDATARALTADEIVANCQKAVEPNKISYIDAQGIMYEIYVPQGTYKTAVADLVSENWADLGKFPAWANQIYEEGDFTLANSTTVV